MCARCQLLQVGNERAAVYGMQPGSSSVVELAVLEALIPPGTKKAPKLYTAACHPVLPHIVAVASNTGTPSLRAASSNLSKRSRFPSSYWCRGSRHSLSGQQPSSGCRSAVWCSVSRMSVTAARRLPHRFYVPQPNMRPCRIS